MKKFKIIKYLSTGLGALATPLAVYGVYGSNMNHNQEKKLKNSSFLLRGKKSHNFIVIKEKLIIGMNVLADATSSITKAKNTSRKHISINDISNNLNEIKIHYKKMDAIGLNAVFTECNIKVLKPVIYQFQSSLKQEDAWTYSSIKKLSEIKIKASKPVANGTKSIKPVIPKKVIFAFEWAIAIWLFSIYAYKLIVKKDK